MFSHTLIMPIHTMEILNGIFQGVCIHTSMKITKFRVLSELTMNLTYIPTLLCRGKWMCLRRERESQSMMITNVIYLKRVSNLRTKINACASRVKSFSHSKFCSTNYKACEIIPRHIPFHYFMNLRYRN